MLKFFFLVVCSHHYESIRWSSIINIPWYLQDALLVGSNLGQFSIGLVK